MPPYRDRSITLENVAVIFKNFEGRGDKFNRPGDRNFAIILDDKKAEELMRDGWAVKRLKPRENDTEPRPYILKITAKMDGRKPARLVMITTRNRTVLDEEMAELLDLADIEFADVKVRPYDWEVNGESGRKAYLVTIYAKIFEDYLDLKYEHLELTGGNNRLELESGQTALPPGSDPNIIDGEIISDSWDDDHMTYGRKELTA